MDRSEPDLNPPIPAWNPWRWLVPAVLVISALLRVVLVRQGGQMFWSDETRFNVSREAAGQLAAHDYGAAVRALLGGADHLFFKIVGLLPAGIERLLGASGDEIPAYFFASFSVLNIFLVWRLARATGAGVREEAVAALLLAMAATNFYYARHLFPYDLSLTFGLLAIWTGWCGEANWRRSLACGVLAALGFLSYNGAWLFGAVALIGHVLLAPTVRRAGGRALWSGAGLVLPLGVFIGLARLAGVDLVASFLYFSKTINQGDFGRGGRLLFEYFWSAEGPNLVLGLAGLLLAAAGALAARRWNRGALWCAGAAGVVLGLLLLSDGWPKFVIYGRTARFVVPLVCLASAYALERCWLLGGRAGRLATAAVVFVLGQGAANLWTPVRQVFPRQFIRAAADLKQELQAKGEQRQLVVIYADMLVGRGSLIEALPDHDVLLAEKNPLQYRPYLAEGFAEEARELLGRTDVRMRLIAVNHARFDYPSDLRRPYPGVVQMTLRLPELRPAGVPEPLLVTGETGRGDFLYLVYQADASIRIGFDHWNSSGKISDPIPVDPAMPVVINLSMGPLHDPQPESMDATAVDAREWLYVEVNDRIVWSHRAAFHAAPPASISYLSNYIGGSTAGRKFSGTVVKIQSLLVPPFSNQRDETR